MSDLGPCLQDLHGLFTQRKGILAFVLLLQDGQSFSEKVHLRPLQLEEFTLTKTCLYPQDENLLESFRRVGQ